MSTPLILWVGKAKLGNQEILKSLKIVFRAFYHTFKTDQNRLVNIKHFILLFVDHLKTKATILLNINKKVAEISGVFTCIQIWRQKKQQKIIQDLFQ